MKKINIILSLIIISVITLLLLNQNKKQRERVILTSSMQRIRSYLMTYQSENSSFFPSDKILNNFIIRENLPISTDDITYNGNSVQYMKVNNEQQLLCIKPLRYKHYYIIMFANGITSLQKK